ncbi:MAG: hypothetical protein J0I36_20280, partial [Pandoraea sp.]|nr:hypothetical protein [Pandoraea sp.]
MTKRRPGPVMLDVVGLTLSEDDVRLGAPVGHQHRVAEPRRGADPLADQRPDRRIDGGDAQTAA